LERQKLLRLSKREKKGKFKSFEDLQRVKGVGPQVASNLKNDVVAGDKVKKVKKSTSKKSKKALSKKPDTKKLKSKAKVKKTKAKSTPKKLKH